MSGIYAEMACLMQETKGRDGGLPAGGWLLGRVLQAGEGTLRLACDGLELDQDMLWVNASLVRGLEAGDRVLVAVSADRQDYMVLCKVVRL